ncbi:hypothetical protein [Mesobacillus thioparans]|uniref:hypothetical protein n=1 Tax=Mesobacillus thioparans TaxID=370439 RepID=UPI0039EEE679
MISKFNRSSGKRHPSKRVLAAKNEIRAARLINEHDEDDHDWQRERKLKSHHTHSKNTHVHRNKVSQVKKERRQINKLDHEDF